MCEKKLCLTQARRQDSVNGGAKINFGGYEKFILCEFERGTGARAIYPSLDQVNKVRSKDSKKFSGRNRKFKRFFRPKTGDLQKRKKKGLHSKNFTKSVVSPQKSPIWASICTPEAPSLLISLGHSPRLGGRQNFCLGGGTSCQLGGHSPGMPLHGAGSGLTNQKPHRTSLTRTSKINNSALISNTRFAITCAERPICRMAKRK